MGLREIGFSVPRLTSPRKQIPLVHSISAWKLKRGEEDDMSWRFRFRRLMVRCCHPSQLNSFQKALRFPYYSTWTFQKHKKRKPYLNPDLLRSALLSSSDLVSLSFFLWCVRQPNYSHDRATCLLMVDVVARLHDRYRDFPSLVEQLARVGCPIKSQTFLVLLRIYWIGGFYNLVVDTFEQLEILGFAPNTFTLNILMDFLFKIGRADDAFRVLQRIEAPNFLSFNVALCHLCWVNDFANCTYVLRSMIKKGFYPDPRTFELVLDVLCKNSRLEEASKVLSLMITLGVPLSVHIWSILIDGFCRAKRFQMAVFLLEKMCRAGCSPNVVTYTSLVKAFLDSEMVDDAMHILRYMEAKACAPDLILCNVLIRGFGRNGRFDDAIGVFVSMAEIRLVPDRYTFSSLFSTICLSRKLHILPKLVSKHVIDADNMVFNSLLTYFCKANLPSLAVQLYGKMILGLTPDKFSFVGLFNELCDSGRLDEAVNAYSEILMSHPVRDTHAHTAVMQALLQVGKCHEAINLFRRAIADKSALDSVSYTVAMHGLFKGGRGCEVMALFDQMKESGISPDCHVYNVMITGFCKNKDAKLAMQVQQEMIDAGIDLSCTNVVKISSRFSNSGLGCGLLIDTRDSGLVPSLASEATSSSKTVVPAEVLGAACSIYHNDFLEDDTFAEASSSEEMLDMIAVG